MTPIELRPYQSLSIDGLRDGFRRQQRRQILVAPTGAGKCLGRGTPVLMADGTIKSVEDVEAGDSLMGPDGLSRTVLSTTSGREALYRVTPTKGDSYVVNASHLLSLRLTPGASGLRMADGTVIPKGETLAAVEAQVLADSNATARHCLKGWRADAIAAFQRDADQDYDDRLLPAYLLGAWLGDGRATAATVYKPACRMTQEWCQYAESLGLKVRVEPMQGCNAYHVVDERGGLNLMLTALDTMRVLDNKHIPNAYKYASASIRRELLAGLIDSDGHITHKGCDWITNSAQLADDFVFVCRSLGLSCYLSKQRKGIKSSGFSGWYWRASVSGDLSQIPMRDKQAMPRQQIKRHRVHGIALTPIGEGDYFGFEITGDRLFLLGDFTVTHNTVIGTQMVADASAKGTRVIFGVDRVSIVDQTSAMFDKYGIPHGVIQANHWRFRPHERVQVATWQTLEKRQIDPEVRLLIVDECHTVRDSVTKIIEARTDLLVVGLTATPFTKGLGQIYSNLVNVTTTNRLIEEGFLCPLKVYIAAAPDMTGAKVVAGEWVAKEAAKRGTAIIGDIVEGWIEKTQLHFGGPVKTIVFSADVDHGEELCKQFQAAGYNFQQISYKDANDDRRRELVDEFRKPDSSIVGLVSCEALAKGFDVPDILCGIAARPYRKSLSGHIQMMGRAMRSAPGKTFALWLDHCGNYGRFKHDVDNYFENGIESLDDADLDSKTRKEPDEEERDDIRCAECGFVMPPKAKLCPACGHERARRAIRIAEAGELLEVDATASRLPHYLQDKPHVWSQLCTLSMHRKGNDEEAAKKFARVQFKEIYGSWPNLKFEPDNSVPCGEGVKSYVVSRLIKWAKSQQRRAA